MLINQGLEGYKVVMAKSLTRKKSFTLHPAFEKQGFACF